MSEPIVHRPGCAKPDVRDVCDCGANRSCMTCGWGAGQYPCACNRDRYTNTARGGVSPSGAEPRLLVGKHPKTDGATFALDAEARCACGDLLDDHPTLACGFPRAPAAGEPGEQPC